MAPADREGSNHRRSSGWEEGAFLRVGGSDMRQVYPSLVRHEDFITRARSDVMYLFISGIWNTAWRSIQTDYHSCGLQLECVRLVSRFISSHLPQKSRQKPFPHLEHVRAGDLHRRNMATLMMRSSEFAKFK